MSKALLAMLFTAARLTSVSYDPQGALQLVLYFPQAMATPESIQLTFPPGLAISPDAEALSFDQKIGFFETNSTSGQIRSFLGPDSHLVPNGTTIDPRQTILDFDVASGRLRIEQVSSLIPSILAGTYLTFGIPARFVQPRAGLVKVEIGDDIAYVYLSDGQTQFVPIVAYGQAGPFGIDTLTQISNPGCEPIAPEVHLFEANGTLVDTMQLEIDPLGSRVFSGSAFSLPKGITSGSLTIERCPGCGASNLYDVKEHQVCPTAGACEPVQPAGSAGISSPQPANNVIFPHISGDTFTGLPVTNPSTALTNPFPPPATVTLTLVAPDGMTVIEQTQITVDSQQTVSRFTEEHLPGGRDTNGDVVISSDVPLSVTTLNNDNRGVPQASIQPICINGELYLPMNPPWNR